MFSISNKERRHDVRSAVSRPVKIRCRLTERYYSGVTSNVSQGGAMIDVDHPSQMVDGQRLEVGIAWTNRQMLLSGDELVVATVMRSIGLNGRQRVAVRFDQRQELANSA